MSCSIYVQQKRKINQLINRSITLIWIVFTARRYALRGLSYRNSVCLYVCLSVCPSVTLVDCVHMVLPTIMISSPYDSLIILVFLEISRSSANSKGVTPSRGVEWGCCGYELAFWYNTGCNRRPDRHVAVAKTRCTLSVARVKTKLTAKMN